MRQARQSPLLRTITVRIGQVVAIYLVAAYAIFAWAGSCFDDKNLAELGVGQPRGALLYVWSPRMVLSAQHAASAQRQAQQRGLAFVPLHDGKVGAAEIQAARTRLASTADAPLVASGHALARSQSLCAASLLERDALRHFPTAFVLQPGGQVHPRPIIGAMPEAAWAHSLAQRLDSSKVAALIQQQEPEEIAATAAPALARLPLQPAMAPPTPAGMAP